MRIPTSLIAVAIFCMALCQPASAATYTVTTTSDSGAGSLRQAIIDAVEAGELPGEPLAVSSAW